MWKILRDPFYGPLLPILGREGLNEAGFFADTATEDLPLDDVGNLCTDLSKVRANLTPDVKRPIVLVATGALCPLHQGHLVMMENARKRMEEAGFDVVGGFLSPGHDEYINTKKQPEHRIPAALRVRMVAAATRHSDWLTVDPWEALGRPVAVNFTDVLVRLDAYLRHHLGREDVQVCFVAGMDNVRFCLTFLQKGMAVFTGRPQAALNPKYADIIAAHSDRLFLSEASGLDVSSSRVLAGDLDGVPPEVRALMQEALPSRVLIRVEHQDLVGFPFQWDTFQKGLRGLFEDAFQGQVRIVYLSSQQARVRAMELPENTVSLDPLFPMSYNIPLSRVYGMGGYTQYGYTVRPGARMDRALESIPEGQYIIFDDDIVSGGTVAKARELLGPQRPMVSMISLETSEGGAQEVADSRDFILGSNQGGLVVALPNGCAGRVPYLYPFVDPSARASIPYKDAREFSRKVWMLNRKCIHPNVCVSDLPAPVQESLLCAGFAAQQPVHSVIDALLKMF